MSGPCACRMKCFIWLRNQLVRLNYSDAYRESWRGIEENILFQRSTMVMLLNTFIALRFFIFVYTTQEQEADDVDSGVASHEDAGAQRESIMSPHTLQRI